MKSTYLVSVIIPVFNVAPFLIEAVESVTNQSHRNLEIILVDDGSNDGSGDLCDDLAHKDHRIRVVHQQNKGLSAARNVGLDLMTGEFVAFLDSDDTYHKQFIERLLSTLTNEGADEVICRYALRQESRSKRDKHGKRMQPLIETGIYNRDEIVNALINNTLNVNVWNKLYRKEIWKEIRFREGHLFEDIEVAYRIGSIVERVCVIDDSLYYYRRRHQSITSSVNQKTINDQLFAFICTEKYIQSSIPLRFSEEQFEMYYRKELLWVIICYVKCARIRGIDVKSKIKLEKKLRMKIYSIGEKIDVKKCDLQTRIAYRFFCFNSMTLVFLYHIYRLARFLSSNIIHLISFYAF